MKLSDRLAGFCTDVAALETQKDSAYSERNQTEMNQSNSEPWCRNCRQDKEPNEVVIICVKCFNEKQAHVRKSKAAKHFIGICTAKDILKHWPDIEPAWTRLLNECQG